MASTLTPFLYQTRTLQRVTRTSLPLAFSRFRHSAPPGSSSRLSEQWGSSESVPFEWDENQNPEDYVSLDEPQKVSTITPSEAEVFRGIFDEIATNKMTASLQTQQQQQQQDDDTKDDPISSAIFSKVRDRDEIAQSMVEQARMTEFKDKTLERFPSSLRDAARFALGQYSSAPAEEKQAEGGGEIDEAVRKMREQRVYYEKIRAKQRLRVEGIMKNCKDDEALWKVMEEEVFTLPSMLGILPSQQHKADKKAKSLRGAPTTTKKGSSSSKKDPKGSKQHGMDVYGPLFPHFLSTGLELFNTAFSRPSLYAFRILPRVKELGLPSYVLGMSTAFYTRLAGLYWHRFGDPNSVVDVLHEMISAGLYADGEAVALLREIRRDIKGCGRGAKGPFVMQMMGSPPYDLGLTKRLTDMERYAMHSMRQSAMEASV